MEVFSLDGIVGISSEWSGEIVEVFVGLPVLTLARAGVIIPGAVVAGVFSYYPAQSGVVRSNMVGGGVIATPVVAGVCRAEMVIGGK
jgi:hypothetical protein